MDSPTLSAALEIISKCYPTGLPSLTKVNGYQKFRSIHIFKGSAASDADATPHNKPNKYSLRIILTVPEFHLKHTLFANLLANIAARSILSIKQLALIRSP